MYFDAEYGQSAPMNLVHAILLYGSEAQQELFLRLSGDMPKEMIFQRELLISRL